MLRYHRRTERWFSNRGDCIDAGIAGRWIDSGTHRVQSLRQDEFRHMAVGEMGATDMARVCEANLRSPARLVGQVETMKSKSVILTPPTVIPAKAGIHFLPTWVP